MPARKTDRKKLISTFETAESNMKWLVNNYDRLKQKYGDAWVAVRDGKVVAHDKEYEHLLEALKDIGANDLPTVAIDFISTVPPNFLL